MNPFEATIELLQRIEATDDSGQSIEIGEAVSTAVLMLREAADSGAQLIFIGNGASQSIASHMAADFLKNGHAKALAFTDASLLTCVGNDLGFDEVFAEPIRRFGAVGDVLVAISSSGRSANVLAGVEAARQAEMRVLAMSGFDAENPLRAAGDLSFWVPSHEYGDVEVVHSAICHRILDEFIASRD